MVRAGAAAAAAAAAAVWLAAPGVVAAAAAAATTVAASLVAQPLMQELKEEAQARAAVATQLTSIDDRARWR